MIETKTLLNKLSKGGCFCNLCNKPVTIDETENAEYVKSKASGEHWYHTSCIKRYRTLGVKIWAENRLELFTEPSKKEN